MCFLHFSEGEFLSPDTTCEQKISTFLLIQALPSSEGHTNARILAGQERKGAEILQCLIQGSHSSL